MSSSATPTTLIVFTQYQFLIDKQQSLEMRGLSYAGYALNIYFVDNECSTILREAFEKHIDNYQFVPPHVHRRNAAERAI